MVNYPPAIAPPMFLTVILFYRQPGPGALLNIVGGSGGGALGITLPIAGMARMFADFEQHRSRFVDAEFSPDRRDAPADVGFAVVLVGAGVVHGRQVNRYRVPRPFVIATDLEAGRGLR